MSSLTLLSDQLYSDDSSSLGNPAANTCIRCQDVLNYNYQFAGWLRWRRAPLREAGPLRRRIKASKTLLPQPLLFQVHIISPTKMKTNLKLKSLLGIRPRKSKNWTKAKAEIRRSMASCRSQLRYVKRMHSTRPPGIRPRPLEIQTTDLTA